MWLVIYVTVPALIIVFGTAYVVLRDRRRGGGQADRTTMLAADLAREKNRAASEASELHSGHGPG